MEWGTPTSMASHHCATWGVAWLGGDALGKMRGERMVRDCLGSPPVPQGDSSGSPGLLPTWPCPSVCPRLPEAAAPSSVT